MSVETMARLLQAAEHRRREGRDRQSGARSASSARRWAPDFIQLSGEDATALGFMAHGGHGCISVTANVAPALCAEFQDACLAGDFQPRSQLQDRLMPLHDALFVEANPGPVKYAASQAWPLQWGDASSAGADRRPHRASASTMRSPRSASLWSRA